MPLIEGADYRAFYDGLFLLACTNQRVENPREARLSCRNESELSFEIAGQHLDRKVMDTCGK
jgi:hypothetical protein